MILAIAMLLDAVMGEPDWLWSRIPHLAVLMGRLIEALEKRYNTGPERRLKGVALIAGLGVGAGLAGWLIAELWFVAEILAVAILLAQRSLADHTADVARALSLSVAEGRRAVARVVGRDTAALQSPEIARAAIESAAENLSDAVVAPVFWYLVAGLPGLLCYKVINTADSMIGYRTERYAEFGWAAARLDDLVNLIPARLSALLVLVSHNRVDALRAVFREAPKHRSPNAGWPEAAVAHVLNIALSGPRAYHGEMRDYPFVNATGKREIGPTEICATVDLLWRVWLWLLGIAIILGLMGWLI